MPVVCHSGGKATLTVSTAAVHARPSFLTGPPGIIDGDTPQQPGARERDLGDPGGQSWKNAAGRSWLDANIPCCEKAFVTCHKEKEEIRTIAWRSIAGLMGTIPPQLGLLTSLGEINVERTDLSGTLPDALFSASSAIEKAPLPPARASPPPKRHCSAL